VAASNKEEHIMSTEVTRRRFLGMAAGAIAAVSTGIRAAEQPSSAGSEAPVRRKRIVDSHVHLKHGDAAGTEYPADAIVEVMDKVGIDRSVVFAMSTTTQRSIELAEKAVSKYPDRLIPYVYALPHYQRPVIEEIESALSGRLFRGVKIHAGQCTLAEYVIDPVLEVAGQYRAPCLIDCLGNLAAASRMAKAFPGTKLIIAHMGRYLSTDSKLLDQFITLAAECDNVLLDVSGVVIVEKIAAAVRRIGSARLAWGTDGPHPKPDTVAFARSELDKVRQLDLAQEDKDNLLGQTIVRLLAL
jgi:predicted TIM-barrel fold metal-dependent hydrolase